MIFSPWPSGSTQLGGRQVIGTFGIKSSVRQRSTLEFANKERERDISSLDNVMVSSISFLWHFQLSYVKSFFQMLHASQLTNEPTASQCWKNLVTVKPLIEAGSPIETGSLIQAGYPIEAGCHLMTLLKTSQYYFHEIKSAGKCVP